MNLKTYFRMGCLAGFLGVAGLFIEWACPSAYGQDQDRLTAMITQFKTDPRGPWTAIRWFCPDGTVLPASARCGSPGGIQHAVPKTAVLRLAEDEGIYWGQILAGTPVSEFLDAGRHFSRLKQYQMERYLQRVDDGWILRKARYYRGAIQFEDESAWGVDFLQTVLADDRLVETQFFLLRQATGDIPHFADDSRWQFIRSQSQTIAEAFPDFMPLRIKLHGRPEPDDAARLKAFLDERKALDAGMRSDIEALTRALEEAYGSDGNERLRALARRLPKNIPSRKRLSDILEHHNLSVDENDVNRLADRWTHLAELLTQIRRDIRQIATPAHRLTLMDLSTAVEEVLFLETTPWRPATVGELLRKIAIVAQGCAGAGYLEMWEWQQVAPLFAAIGSGSGVDLNALAAIADTSRRIAEWGAAMVRAHYRATVERYETFEPLARGFADDRVRASLLLPLGDAASQLQAVTAAFGTSASHVMDLSDTGRMRGLNPGYALGALTVLDRVDAHTVLSEKNIYIMPHAPPDLKPVAGIATVSEGNLVSHVQLLSRNLGIPNAILSEADLNSLRVYSGETVFYAVSPGGTVIMKPAEAMTVEEKNLVASRRRSEERVPVPLDRIDLKPVAPIPLSQLKASDSGRWCGPKAANLGQLKHDFPEHVVDGFVIPFGAFRQHMDQAMPGTGLSYWHYLQQTFDTANGESAGQGDRDAVILDRLSHLRQAIGRMAFLPDFETAVRDGFRSCLGVDMGGLPVFVRSDTNMEDLKDFTGAGLNLTVFNVRDEALIFQAIRDVWASAYTERSYRWRQRFMTNPENIYPSILVLPTVDVAKSGVMITTGVTGGHPDDITVAFSRGAGGAVEGQMAEAWRLAPDGSVVLLSPAREPFYTVLPEAGGVSKAITSFETPLLDEAELGQLRRMAATVKQRLAEGKGIGSGGPWDIELGFRDGRIWLFQIRPFVENKRARSSAYLNQLDPAPPENRDIPLGWILP